MEKKTRIGALLLFGLLALLVLPAFTPADASSSAACELVFEPAAPLTAGSAAQEVKVTLAISDGAEMDPAQIATLRSPEESGLKIARVEGDAFVIAVDLSAAKAGEWQIEAYARSAGDEPQEPLCTGTLKVQ